MSRLCLATMAAALALGGCVSSQAVSPQVEIIDHPPINANAQAELGDTILEKGKLSTYDGLILKNELTWGDGIILKKINISPGRLRERQQDENFKYFYSDKMTMYDALLGTSPYFGGGLCTKKADQTFVRLFIIAGRCIIKSRIPPEIEPTRITDADAPGLRQELIYNGRSGDTVKFLYREFAGDLARPPFSQDIQYDLKDGMTVGFKGARIQIVDASNTKLTYRVLSSFPDQNP